MRQLRKTISGYIAKETGSEGPQHDPYSFTEYVIQRTGTTLTLHLGLGVWLRLNGITLKNYETEADCVEAFEKFARIDIAAFERALNHRPRMSRKERWEMEQIEAADAALLRYAM
jgi:hypothetical protein